VTAIVLLALGWFHYNRPRPTAPREVFQGVVYSCEELPQDAEGSGQVYIVQVDFTRPGIELYVTPLDPQAVAKGWEYRLRWTPSVAKEERLSVTVNGTLFENSWGKIRMPGDYARAVETVIADHQVNHVDPYTFLLWFEEDLTPHLETKKPPPSESLRRARFGIGSQVLALHDGKVPAWAGHKPEAQVLAGLAPGRKLLILAAFENASLARAARMMAERGAVNAIALDGGGSVSMTLGPGARGIGSKTLLWPRRAVATHFGIRAPSLEN
jgi:hypothetical protein